MSVRFDFENTIIHIEDYISFPDFVKYLDDNLKDCEKITPELIVLDDDWILVGEEFVTTDEHGGTILTGWDTYVWPIDITRLD